MSLGASKNNVGKSSSVEPGADIETMLSDEIKAVREQNKRFAATNDHETYLIVAFSCKEDKERFSDEVGITEHTLVDGYALARALNVEPRKPKFRLHDPFKLPKKRQ